MLGLLPTLTHLDFGKDLLSFVITVFCLPGSRNSYSLSSYRTYSLLEWNRQCLSNCAGNNGFWGLLPTEIGRLTQLTFLRLGTFCVSCLSVRVRINSFLLTLFLPLHWNRLYLSNCTENNRLSGSLPSEIGRLVNLNYLWLRKFSESHPLWHILSYRLFFPHLVFTACVVGW